MCIRDRWYQRRVHGEAVEEVLNLETFTSSKMESLLEVKDLSTDEEHQALHHKVTPLYFVEKTKRFPKDDFDRRVGTLLWEPHGEMKIYRIKGILNFSDREYPCSLQGIDDTYEIKEYPNLPWRDNIRASKVLVIGSDLNRSEIQRILFSEE
eukprot:TRINITY_DN7837_c0_g1_i1.p1 TRINITY_DN7837_c0_g1~~TRINITY_DN7837_c0_g1_i1.p1  ORF type:complete len:152 (+),score=50.34 TRINITY_DN7837_c0_g1_i1:64-519(+)